MKSTIKLLAAGLLAISLSSCRNNDAPEDIHEHEEVNKVVFTITEKGTGSTQTISYQIGSGADKTLTLENGKTYTTDIKFYGLHNGEAEDMTSEIIKEKDEHFMEYQFAGTNVGITRNADDVVRSDSKKLGIKTTWTVTSTPANALAKLKLIHGATKVDDKANNGGGSHEGGEEDVIVSLTVK